MKLSFPRRRESTTYQLWMPAFAGMTDCILTTAILAGFKGVRVGLGISSVKTIVTIVLSMIAIFLVNYFVINAIFARIF